MKKTFKIAGLLGIALVLFFAVALFVLYHLIQIGEFRRVLIGEVERRTQLKIRVGEGDLQMGRVVGISFRDFALLGPEDSRPVITAPRILIRVALLPLLERKTVFQEIRFYRPTLHIAREDGDKSSLLDLVAQLSFGREEDARFTVDFRRIKVEKGEFILPGRRGESGIVHFREVDLELERIQAEGLTRTGSEGVPLKAATHGSGMGEQGLEFSIKGAVEKDGQRAGLASKGKILFPGGAFDLRQARLDADVHVRGLPASLFWDYYGHLLPVRVIRGTLGSRLRWQGSLAERIRVKGTVDFKRLDVVGTEDQAGIVPPRDGRLELEAEWTPQEVRFPRLDLRSGEISLAAKGTMRSLGEEDPHLEIHLTTPFLPLAKAWKYIPSGALESPDWESLLRALDQGELRLAKAGVAGRLSEIRRLFDPGFEDHIWMDAELRDVGGDLTGDRYLPVRDVSGRILLEKGTLHIKGLKGMYGLSRLERIEGSHKGVLTGRGLLELRVRGEMDLGDLRKQSRLGSFPAHLTEMTQELDGKGKFEITLRKPFASSYHFQGQLSLENGRLRIDDLPLTQIKGELFFSPGEIRAKRITALLAGSPLHVRGTLSRYLSEKSSFDIMVESSGVKAGAVTRILLGSGSPQDPGTVRGALRYQGSLVSTEDRKLSGSLELIGAQLPLKLFDRPLRDVVGRVRLDGKGIDFRGLKGRVDGSGFDFSGRWRRLGKPQLVFTLRSRDMDVGHLLSQNDAGADDWYDRLQAKGKISIRKGSYEGFEFSDLKTDLTLDKRLWRLENFSARSVGGTVRGVGSFIDDPEGLRFSVEPEVRGVPVKEFLGWFDIGTREITGKVDLTGKLDSSGKTGSERKRNLNGAFRLEIKDGIVRRFRTLVRILNLLDLSRWFSLKMPDINQKGIRFRSITGDFRVSRGVYSTENLLLDSEELRITGAGQIDGPKDEIDFVVAVRPFPGVDSAVNFIPLIGQGIAAVKNSLLVAGFRIQGPADSPTVTPTALSTLSEYFYKALAIPKGLIGGGGEEERK